MQMARKFDEEYSGEFDLYFNYFWKTVVLPMIDRVYSEIEDDFKAAVDLEYAFKSMDAYKSRVKAFYREKREWLKGVYLPHERHPRLDQHKIGALWCRTLLAYKPFTFDLAKAEKYISEKFPQPPEDDFLNPRERENDHSEWFSKNIYANYRVAYLVATGIVYLYLIHDCKEMEPGTPDYLRDGGYAYFWEAGVLRPPVPRAGHTNFDASCIIALEKNDTNNRDFDYLMFAIVLYQLEYYNKVYYYMKKNGLPVDCEPPLRREEQGS